MSVGLLIITHNQIGEAMIRAATTMLGFCPLLTETLSVPGDCDPDAVAGEARAAVARLDRGDGVLVLTDIFGSTPSNIASGLREHDRVAVVAGLSLPMLVRVLNYPRLDLETLQEKAFSGGRDGVVR